MAVSVGVELDMTFKNRTVAAGMTLTILCLCVGCKNLPFEDFPFNPFKKKPVEYQEIGIIQFQDRFVPREIQLVTGRPARLHITSAVEGASTEVSIEGLAVSVVTSAGRVSTLTLESGQIKTLEGRTLKSGLDGVRAIFRVSKNKGGEPMPIAPADGAAEIAVVMADEFAAPRQITLMRGVPVRLYVTKTDSDVGFDNFECDRLGIKLRVADRKVETIVFRPDRSGTFVFMGTVTPDSRVNIVVIDGPGL